MTVRVRARRGTSLGNAPRIASRASESLSLTAYLACWRVLDARVAGCLPLTPDALAAGCAGFCFGLRDAAGLVDWAAEGLRLAFGAAGLDWRLVVGAERLLPRGVVGSWLAGPAGCIGGTGIPTVGCVVR